MKLLALFLLLFVQMSFVLAQTPASKDLFDGYERHREPALAYQYLTRPDIAPLIAKLKQVSDFEVSTLSKSVEGREINLIKWGNGPIRVLLWSQMHGDEPTATMALFDIFRFLQASDAFDPWRKQLSERLTLYFVPMLNPDGADRFTRRNAFQFDLNRDALRLQSPEARILKAVRDSLNPSFGFNLHDQSTLYSAGKTGKSAAISFLAPAYNEAKEINHVRKPAMQLIGLLNREIQAFIPGHVGKYNDEFEPRAFGDNIQKWGTSTILVETGGYPNDPEKQFLRKINYTLLLTAFGAIAERSYRKIKLDAYYQIPDNERYLFDLLIRNAQVETNGAWHTADIAVNFSRFHPKGEKGFRYRASIAEMGDLSPFFGYQELEAGGMRAVPGLVAPDSVANLEALQQLDFQGLWKKGVTHVPFAGQEVPTYLPHPVNLLSGGRKPNNGLRLGNAANFVLQHNGEVRWVVLNGFLIEVGKGIGPDWKGNGLGN